MTTILTLTPAPGVDTTSFLERTRASGKKYEALAMSTGQCLAKQQHNFPSRQLPVAPWLFLATCCVLVDLTIVLKTYFYPKPNQVCLSSLSPTKLPVLDNWPALFLYCYIPAWLLGFDWDWSQWCSLWIWKSSTSLSSRTIHALDYNTKLDVEALYALEYREYNLVLHHPLTICSIRSAANITASTLNLNFAIGSWTITLQSLPFLAICT